MMDTFALDWLTAGTLASAGWMFDSALLIGLILFAATTALVAFCVPGVILPLSLGSGALLGGWAGAAVVGLGAVAGSQILFLAARGLARERLSTRLGDRIVAFERRFAAHGIWYVIGLRLIGTPHFLVTAGSAIMRMKPQSFAAATIIGMIPHIAIAAATGSAI